MQGIFCTAGPYASHDLACFRIEVLLCINGLVSAAFSGIGKQFVQIPIPTKKSHNIVIAILYSHFVYALCVHNYNILCPWPGYTLFAHAYKILKESGSLNMRDKNPRNSRLLTIANRNLPLYLRKWASFSPSDK